MSPFFSTFPPPPGVSSVYKFPVDFNLLKAEKQMSLLSITESNAAIYYLELNKYLSTEIHPFIHSSTYPTVIEPSTTYSFCVCSAYFYMSENFLLQLFLDYYGKIISLYLKPKEYSAKARNVLGRKASK